jgi:hypothetical protein
MKKENINHFSKQSIWGMIGLTLVTLMFYFPFWMRKISRVINELLPSNTIGTWFFPVSIILTALNYGMVIPEILTGGNPNVKMVSNLMNQIDSIVMIVWAFNIRNRMNVILEAEKKSPLWFNAFWTFFLQIFYIQFRINKIKTAEQLVCCDGQPTPKR